MRGRRIAFDYGQVRTGVAICDADGILTSPLCTLETKSKDFLTQVSALLAEYEPVRIFIGNPLTMAGTTGESSEKVSYFVTQLEAITSVPIRMVDERLSTVSAQRKLKEAQVSSRDSKSLIDAMAAVAILEQGLLSEKNQ
jgi:putative Holliday junction resolvase